MVSIGIMAAQINVRMPEKLLEATKKYSKEHGYENVQEFIRETIRHKLYSDLERFKGIIKGNKRMSHKERMQLLEEFMKKDTSNIFREFNLKQ